MPAVKTREYGDTLLKELQVAGATSKEVVSALNELVYAGTARVPYDGTNFATFDPPYEFDQALRAYIAIP